MTRLLCRIAWTSLVIVALTMVAGHELNSPVLHRIGLAFCFVALASLGCLIHAAVERQP